MANKKIRNTLLAIVAILILWFVWYTISPLFIDKKVSEDFPFEIEETTTQETSSSEEEVNNEIEQEPIVAASLTGEFAGSDAIHEVEGNALILENAGKTYIRFEEFKSTNGPDLKVYLATNNQATDFVDLGELKGNIGDQNYEIPQGTDLEKYNNVLIWCEQFGVLFGTAVLN